MSNIFADHGFAADDATVLALKSDVARAIREAIASKTQKAVTAQLGLAQSDISRIVRGDLAALSLERLIKVSVRLNLEMCAQWSGDAHCANAVASKRAATVTATMSQRRPEGPAVYYELRST